MAHDLNNFLLAVMGSAEMLDMGATDEVALGYIDTIKRAALDGRDLINRLLAFSRRGNPTVVPVDLREVLSGAIQLTLRGRYANTLVETDFSASRVEVEGDAGQLQNAFLNLIQNAELAVPDQGAASGSCWPTSIPTNPSPAGSTSVVGPCPPPTA